jgi:hypothetical protein
LVQFFGYEVANVVLVAHHAAGATAHGPDLESLAAASFLVGSACIYGFHPERRPGLLLHGGLALAAGGLLLARPATP